MQIVDNRGLLLKVRNPNRILEVIPNAKLLDSGEVLVKWGLEEVRVLKNIGIKNVPSPITAKYNWPGMYAPFEHQVTTSSFLTLHRRAFCFNEMGTGKSASAIWAADYLMRQKIIRRVLILCPLSIMQSAWEGDLFRVAMHRTVAIAHSYKAQKRIDAVYSDAEFVIANYEGVEIIKDAIIECGDFDLIIVDEGTHYKTHTTRRWKALNAIIRPDTWVWLMTGTPAAQSPADAYGLARLLNKESVPTFYGAFRDQVMVKITQFKWVPKPNAEDIVHQVLQPAIRYTKEECLDLPDMMYVTREVELTPQQIKYYEAIRKDMIVHAAGETISTPTAAANLNKLLQLSGGAVYADNREVITFDAQSRVNALLEVIEEASHKVIVFVPFRHTIEILADLMRSQKISCGVVHGGVSAGKRTEIFNEFQTTPDPHVLIIQPRAASHGVTLHAANVVVWWGPTTSVETYLQANARVHRAGQRNPCTVVHLQGSPVERHIYKMLGAKIDGQDNLMELYKNILKEGLTM